MESGRWRVFTNHLLTCRSESPGGSCLERKESVGGEKMPSPRCSGHSDPMSGDRGPLARALCLERVPWGARGKEVDWRTWA